MVDVSAWHQQLHRNMPVDAPAASQSLPLVRFRDIDGCIEQPPLGQTVLAMHLGGPKRVLRRQGTRTNEFDVIPNSLTLMPAGEAFEWETFGSIDFVHLTIDDPYFGTATSEDLDCNPATLRLQPLVGVENPPTAKALNDLVAAASHFGGEQLYYDTVSLVSSIEVVELFGRSRACGVARRRAGTLATWQLRRVTDHMREHLADDIQLATLVSLTGLARAQFFRSFRRSVGRTPLAHLRYLRLLKARQLLVATKLSITQVASAVGLEPTRLSEAFKEAYQITPSAFRAAARS